MKTLFIAASAIALMASVPAFASSNHPNRTFVNKATDSNLAQIQLGRLAVQKGTKPDIKEFGRWLASDSMVLNKTLVSLHKLDGITPHSTPSASGMFLEQQVQTLKGKKFDKKFLQAVADENQRNMVLYRDVAGNTTSYNNHNNNNHYKSSLQFYARDAMPMLQAHLTEARRLMKIEGVAAAVPPVTPATASSTAAAPSARMSGTRGSSGAMGNSAAGQSH